MKELIILICLIVMLATKGYCVDYSLDVNCQGFFAMEDSGTETDRGGNTSNDLTETGGTIPTSTDNKFGTYSRDFEAADTEYLEHADSLDTDINGANQAISIVFWYKRESDTGDFEAIVSKWISGGGQYAVDVGGGLNDVFEFYLTDDGNYAASKEAVGATAVPVGSWTHFAGVYNDTDIRIYFNGSLDSNGADNPQAYTAGIVNGAETFKIGLFGTNEADGLIDDVAIFDRALTSTEVLDIYNNGVTGIGASTIFFGANF